jgi:multiple sugar transport system substrate-binding protein
MSEELIKVADPPAATRVRKIAAGSAQVIRRINSSGDRLSPVTLNWILFGFLAVIFFGSRLLPIYLWRVPENPLIVWVIEGPESNALKDALSRPDVYGIANSIDRNVRIYSMGYDELQRCVFRAAEIGKSECRAEMFDVLLADDPWFPAISKSLEPLPPPPAIDDYVPVPLWLNENPDGTYMGYPWTGNAQLLCYNQKLLPTLDTSDWTKILKRIDSFRSDGEAYPVVLRAINDHAIVTDFVPLLWAFDQASLPVYPQQGSMLGRSAAQAAGKLVELGKKAPVGYMYFDDADVGEFLWQGKAGLGIVWAAWAMQMARQHQAEAISRYRDLRFVSLPAGGTEMGVWYLTVRRDSPQDRKNRAIHLLRTLSAPEVMKRAALAGTPPVRPSSFESPNFHSLYPFHRAIRQSIEVARPRPRHPKWGDIENVLGEALVDVHLTPKRSEAILTNAERRIAEVVAH